MVTWHGDEKLGQQQLALRNPPPIQQFGEEMGKLGLEEAWGSRKELSVRPQPGVAVVVFLCSI